MVEGSLPYVQIVALLSAIALSWLVWSMVHRRREQEALLLDQIREREARLNLALWGSGPGYAMDANMLLAWHKYGGGKELLDKLYASIGANVVSFPYGPMPTQPLAGVHAFAGDADLDMPPVQEAAAARDVVPLIGMQLVRALASSASGTTDERDRIDEI